MVAHEGFDGGDEKITVELEKMIMKICILNG